MSNLRFYFSMSYKNTGFLVTKLQVFLYSEGLQRRLTMSFQFHLNRKLMKAALQAFVILCLHLLQGVRSTLARWGHRRPPMSSLQREPRQTKRTKGRNTALLTWSTTHEENTSHFVIEKSSDAGDWHPVGQVMAGAFFICPTILQAV